MRPADVLYDTLISTRAANEPPGGTIRRPASMPRAASVEGAGHAGVAARCRSPRGAAAYRRRIRETLRRTAASPSAAGRIVDRRLHQPPSNVQAGEDVVELQLAEPLTRLQMPRRSAHSSRRPVGSMSFSSQRAETGSLTTQSSAARPAERHAEIGMRAKAARQRRRRRDFRSDTRPRSVLPAS